MTLAECDLEKARERCRRLLFKHGVGSRAAAVLFAIARKERAVSLAREALRKAEKELRDSGWKPVIETD
ncbi:MAG: hypothetical protein KQJ78_24040 [Deltaproteobacteria bacterium]|nr:hypothetical protein [Deltaproteobacteria bacterium]